MLLPQRLDKLRVYWIFAILQKLNKRCINKPGMAAGWVLHGLIGHSDWRCAYFIPPVACLPLILYVTKEKQLTESGVQKYCRCSVSMFCFFFPPAFHLHYMKLSVTDRYTSGWVCVCVFSCTRNHSCAAAYTYKYHYIRCYGSENPVWLLCHVFTADSRAPGNTPWALIYLPLLSSALTFVIHLISVFFFFPSSL